MADFFFFTEPSKLNNQTTGQAFGAIDENQFRVGNVFSASADAKAFAVITGNVLVQQVDGSASLVNIILKPEDQPNLNLPKIDYIIYKGVVKSSIISTTKVAAPSKNDLTRKIWESHSTLLAEMPDAPPEPLAADALGYGYSASATDDYKALDTDGLNVAFYNNNNKLFRINAGDYIGDFKASAFGIVVVLEKIGFDPKFELARELDSTISFAALDSAATDTEKFRRKHDKENVLSFLDSTAFFGAFDGQGIKVTSDGTNFIKKDPETFFQDVISKHFNKNTLYLDIRNEYLDSFNYYENYANELKLDLVGEEQFTEINYYRNQWPWFAIVDSEFDIENTEKTIGLALNIGDNEFPRAFLKRGEIFNIDLEKSNNPSLRFLDLETDDDEAHYKIIDKIRVPRNDNGLIKANYFQLRYIKRYATSDSSYQGLSLRKESYLDNLFPIFDMKLPYVYGGTMDMKMFSDASYIDKSNINEIEFTVDLGVAKDADAYSFVAMPQAYNEDTLNVRGKVPLYSEQVFNDDSFIDHFNKKTTVESIRSDVFQTTTESYEYLAFAETLDEVVLLDPESAVIDDDIMVENSILDYDFENINILSLTSAQMITLESIKDTEFISPYKVYLGIANTQNLQDGDESFSKTFYALRGLKENGSGDLEPHEVITDIEVLASESLYNWIDARRKKCVIEFRAVTSDYREGNYGFDWLRPNYDSIITSDYDSLKQEYTPKPIFGEDYYVPWLSIRKNQTVKLKLEKSFRRKNDFNTIEINNHPDFTISTTDFKGDNEIEITCLNESTTPSQLIVNADGIEAGALNIWHPSPKTIDLDWVFVEFSGSNDDETDLSSLINKSKLEDAFKKGMNPALISISVNINFRAISMSTKYGEYVSQGFVPATSFDFGDGSEEYFDALHTVNVNGQDFVIKNFLHNDVPIADTQHNSSKLTLYCINRRLANSTNPDGSYALVGGFSPTKTGIAYISKGRSGDVMAEENIIHEVLHALGMKHSFANGPHTFEQGKTDNYLDYNNSKRHTWHWQWENAFDYPDLTIE